MRLQGRVTEWNDDRGFGFVTQNGTGGRAFLHVSRFRSRRRPVIGSLISYEIQKDGSGRLQAVEAQFVGDAKTASSNAAGTFTSAVVGLIIVLVTIYVGYLRVTNPNSTVSASAYKAVFARDALRPHPEFSCDPGKNSCSKMTSCAEALYHRERCGVPDMDSDNDGIPCEHQWCN
jgi:cold shock CspA family protein